MFCVYESHPCLNRWHIERWTTALRFLPLNNKMKPSCPGCERSVWSQNWSGGVDGTVRTPAGSLVSRTWLLIVFLHHQINIYQKNVAWEGLTMTETVYVNVYLSWTLSFWFRPGSWDVLASLLVTCNQSDGVVGGTWSENSESRAFF